MQFSVPQFTDVEDKIIGPLTIKQFGIIFAAGGLIFMIYSLTKSAIGLVIAIILIGIPGLGLAFGKFNGRPVYSSFGTLLNFFLQPRQMLFHKDGLDPAAVVLDKVVELNKNRGPQESSAAVSKKLHDLNYQLQQQAKRQAELSHQVKH